MNNNQWQPPPQNGAWGQQLPPAQGTPPQQGGYPPPQQGGYPPPQGYAPQQGGYPAPQQGYGQPNYGADPLAGLHLTSGDPTMGGERLPYLEAGDHILKIHKIEYKPTRGGRGKAAKNFVITTVEIVQTNTPEDHPIGARFTAWLDMSNTDMRGINVAKLLSAANNVDPASIPKDSPVAPWTDASGQQPTWTRLLQEACDPQAQPYRDRYIASHSYSTETQAGGDFTVHDWKPAQGFVIGPPPVQRPKHEAPPTAAGAWPPSGGGWQIGPGPQQPMYPPQGGYGQPPGAPGAAPPQQGFGGPSQGAPPGGFGGPPPQQPGFGGPPQGAPAGFPQQGAPVQGHPQQNPGGPPQGAPPGYPTGPWGQPPQGGQR
jgi:hypothetical protein